MEFIMSIHDQKSKDNETREQIEKMARSEYGNFGLRVLREISNTKSDFFRMQYELVEEEFNAEIKKQILV